MMNTYDNRRPYKQLFITTTQDNDRANHPHFTKWIDRQRVERLDRTLPAEGQEVSNDTVE